MTSRRHQIEGLNLIQSPEITSSTDPSFNINCNLPAPRFPLRRRTYRTFTSNQYMFQPDSNNVIPSPNPGLRTSSSISLVESLSTSTSVICVAIIFLCSLLALSVVYMNFPQLSHDEKQHMRIPWNIEEAKHLGLILNRYKYAHYWQVVTGVCIMYIFLQTFAIPGSLFLSILSGFLFPFVGALALICSCSAIGASLCFLLSQLLGRKLIFKFFPERASQWAVIVNNQRDNLLNYIIFLRVTPFLPNWFINLTAPVIGVPLKPFALGTFLGVAPPSFIAIQTGQTLNTMASTDASFSWTSVTLLTVFAVVSLIPIFFKEKFKTKFE